MKRLNLWAACALTLALAACGRPVPQQAAPGENPGSGDPSAIVVAPAGYGKLKVRKIYDYVGDRAGTPWAPFELNGDYNYPEPILGGWPVRVTPVDAGGSPTGPVVDTTTLQEMSPTDGRYLELPIGRYKVEELFPTATSGGGVWEQTGANATQGGTTTSLGATRSAFVEVVAGTDEATATVVRFFNVCRVNGAVQTFPAAAVADVRAAGVSYPCKPSFDAATSGQITGAVASQKAGSSVAGVLVKAVGSSESTTTDANGRFSFTVPVSVTALELSKPGYSAVRVEGFDVASGPVELDEVMRPLFDPAVGATAPGVTVDVAQGQGFTDGVSVRVQTAVAAPDKTQKYFAAASLGRPGGSSGFLNASVTRAVDFSQNNDVTLALGGANVKAFAGAADLHVIVYDASWNRTHIIRRINLNVSGLTETTPAMPTALAATAVTFSDESVFGTLGASPNLVPALEAQARGDSAPLRAAFKAAAAGGARLQPQGAPEGSLLIVNVAFKYAASAPLPTAFEVWRSFDGVNYAPINKGAPGLLCVRTAAGACTENYVYRDTSAALAAGQTTYYKVAAVSGASRVEAMSPTSVTPLGRYDVRLTSPGQLATGVARVPVFRWETSGAGDGGEVFAVIVWDRVQAEGRELTYVSDDIFDAFSHTYNADGGASLPSLQPNHAYDWQLAALTFNADFSAFAVAADYYNLYGAVTGVPFESQDGPVNEFITGGN